MDSNNYFRDFFLEIFYFQNGDGQTAWCVVGKTTMFYHGFGYKMVDPDFLLPGEMPNGPALTYLELL